LAQHGRTDNVEPSPFSPSSEAAFPSRLDAKPALLRGILTGVCGGAVLAGTNVYLGLKVGFGTNMSIVAALAGFGFWGTARLATRRLSPFSLLENNLNQTAASSAGTAGAAGLVAAIPALTLLTGQTLPWHALALWVLSVMLVGIVVAVPLRRRLIVRENLRFPAGVASAELLRELHRSVGGALRQLVALLVSALVAIAAVLAVALKWLVAYPLPLTLRGIAAGELTLALSPSAVFVGLGGLIGLRTCVSLLIGAVLAYGVISPALIHANLVSSPDYRGLNPWLLWPGVALMVVAALTSLVVTWSRLRRSQHPTTAVEPGDQAARGATPSPTSGSGVPEVTARRPSVAKLGFVAALLAVTALAAVLQRALFGIPLWSAILAVFLAFILAQVAARVSGETGVTPVGAMGKIPQLAFGLIDRSTPVPNLMAANVAGGAASQCADLLDDLKCGHLLGTRPGHQIVAQLAGAVSGALAGSAAYLLLVPDPHTALNTGQLAMPGARAWKTVAQLFAQDGAALAPGVAAACMVAGGAALVLTLLPLFLPERWRQYAPSAAAIGLAWILPGSASITIFLGGLAAAIFTRSAPRASAAYLVPICAGLIVGESVVGIGEAIVQSLGPH